MTEPHKNGGRPHGPDFIIIGAMKSATSTLHTQLALQSGFFMSEPKEPNFFSDDDIYARGIEWYRQLFAAAPPGALRGESSTHYTKLPTHPHTIERLTAHLGTDLRLIYVMRDPIQRLLSHYVHAWSERDVRGSIREAISTHSPLVDYGFYAMQLEPWLERFGPERVLPIFTAKLAAHPQAELERVCRFLGSTQAPVWQEIERQNQGAERIRRSRALDLLTEGPIATALRRTLVPKSVRTRIRQLFTMRKRPVLSAADRAHLAARFDPDLARLGTWLGLELDCASFDRATRDVEPAWTESAPRPLSRVVS